MCVGILPGYTSVHHMHASWLRSGLTDDCELPRGGPLSERLSLQSPDLGFSRAGFGIVMADSPWRSS